MKIVLINPPLLGETKNLFLTQPLGLASIAAAARESGHEVSIIDSSALGLGESRSLKILDRDFFRQGLDYGEIADLIPPDSDLIGITAPFTHYSYIIEPLIKIIRLKRPNLKIILGGVYPSTLPVRAAKAGSDYIAIGEGEPILLALAGGENIENIPGLYESKFLLNLKSEKDLNRKVGVVDNLDKLPFPARDLLPFETYIKSNASGRGKGEFAVSIHTSRGCPYACNFCSVHSVFKRGYRARSAENVWNEMKGVMEKYGVYNFEFEDDNLTLRRERAVELFGKMAEWNKDREQKISFITPNGVRIDTLDGELLELMKKAGCRRISLAMEHGDSEMLGLMNKKLDLKKVEEVVRDCKKFGINILVYFIIGFPGETKERWKKGIEFGKKLKKINPEILFDVSFAKALPQTPLLDLCRQERYLTGMDPDEMALMGNFSNIETPDFSGDELNERFVQTHKMLNTKSFSRRVLSKIQKSFSRIKQYVPTR